VRWWDTVADQERIESLPAHTIHVLPGTGLNATDNPAPTTTAANGNSVKEISNTSNTAPAESPGFFKNHGVVKASLLTLAAAIVLIGSALLLIKSQGARRTRRQKVDVASPVAPRSNSTDEAELEQRERTFVQACKSNDLRGAYSALNAWLWLLAKTGHQASTPLASEAAEMEKQLFADRGEATWSGRKVLEVFYREQQSRRRSNRHPPDGKSIPTLYPT
jgi:hypothetical protein